MAVISGIFLKEANSYKYFNFSFTSFSFSFVLNKHTCQEVVSSTYEDKQIYNRCSTINILLTDATGRGLQLLKQTKIRSRIFSHRLVLKRIWGLTIDGTNMIIFFKNHSEIRHCHKKQPLQTVLKCFFLVW